MMLRRELSFQRWRLNRALCLVYGVFRRAVATGALAVVGVYRVLLSPLKRTPTCRYLPTCSEYAQVAIRTRGPWIGMTLAAWRILRCNPFSHGGYDPVPRSNDENAEKAHARPR